MLLAVGASPTVTNDHLCETPLHCACTAQVARVLLEAGADVGALDVDGWTPLTAHVVYSGARATADDFAFCQVMLEHGADVNAGIGVATAEGNHAMLEILTGLTGAS